MFASVRATLGIGSEEGKGQLRFPMAMVAPLDAESDSSAPGLKRQRWQVVVSVAQAGDMVGEFALLGGQRPSQGASAGRGLLEVEERLLAALNLADGTLGFDIVLVASSAPEATLDESYGYVAERRYVFESTLSTSRTYPAPFGANALTAVTSPPAVLASPPAPVATNIGNLGPGNGMDAGTHLFALSYVTATGETVVGPTASVVVAQDDYVQCTWDLAATAPVYATHVALYVSKAGGSTLYSYVGNTLGGLPLTAGVNVNNPDSFMTVIFPFTGTAAVTPPTPVALSWPAPAARFDLRNALAVPSLGARGRTMLTRKAGSSAPASPSDGTLVVQSTSPQSLVSYADSLVTGSGTYTYGLFARYDEFGDGATSLRDSAPSSVTVTV